MHAWKFKNEMLRPQKLLDGGVIGMGGKVGKGREHTEYGSV